MAATRCIQASGRGEVRPAEAHPDLRVFQHDSAIDTSPVLVTYYNSPHSFLISENFYADELTRSSSQCTPNTVSHFTAQSLNAL